MRAAWIPVCLFAVFSFSACDSGGPVDYGRASHPIINGTLTSDWEAVGALVVDYQGQWGQFCTGTLIDSEWVLTAAHCVDEDITGVPSYAMSFVMEPDVTYDPGTNTYGVDAMYAHSSWTGSGGNDIGLVHLSTPVSSSVATPIPYNTSNLSSYSSNQLRWVGYGLEDAYNQYSSGEKRTATGYIDTLYSLEYEYSPGSNNTLTCSGDSGGPALMSISGTERVVGIVSRGDEHCEYGGLDTRVDAYQNWISTTMTGGVVDQCDIEGGDCPNQVCYPTSETEVACFPSNGKNIGQSCHEDPNGSSLECADGGICLDIDSASGGYGEVCYQFCESDAVCDTGETCYLPIFEGIDGIGICVPDPETCTITGGDCSSGQACYPTTSGDNYCFASDENGEGQACDPSLTDRLSCDDGLICLGSGTSGLCYSFCESDYDCDAGDACYIPIFSDVEGLGYCDCIDEDSDGYCASDDCDDGDGSVHPGATESCGDNVDNDCDGLTDEGCGSCTDLDGDDYCNDVDCDDTNNTIYPGADERCGDDRDNDCDGLTDEDCSSCTDLDGDGYCAETSDCDDHSSSVNPAADEVCNNGRDDDCDGLTDEDCDGCSSDAQCDDGNPCSKDRCVDGECVYEDEPDGMACGEDMMCQIGQCYPAGDGGGGDGGCATGGAPGAGFLSLLLLGLALRRRR